MSNIEMHSEVMQMREVARWLGGRYTGASSKCMALWLGFGILPEDDSHPWDSGDFGRCVKLLRDCPHLVERVPHMAAVSKTWKVFAHEWKALMALWGQEGFEKVGSWKRPLLDKAIMQITDEDAR